MISKEIKLTSRHVGGKVRSKRGAALGNQEKLSFTSCLGERKGGSKHYESVAKNAEKSFVRRIPCIVGRTVGKPRNKCEGKNAENHFAGKISRTRKTKVASRYEKRSVHLCTGMPELNSQCTNLSLIRLEEEVVEFEANVASPVEEHFSNSDEESQNSSSTLTEVSKHTTELAKNNGYREFFVKIKEAVFEIDYNIGKEEENSLISSVLNLWQLKKKSLGKRHRRLLENSNTNFIDSCFGKVEGVKKRPKRLSATFKYQPNCCRQISVWKFESLKGKVRPSDGKMAKANIKPKRQIAQPIEDIIDGVVTLGSKYLFKGMKRDPVCKYCFEPSGQLLKCSNGCMTWFHVNCLGRGTNTKTKNRIGNVSDIVSLSAMETVCEECALEAPLECCVCHKFNDASQELIVCNMLRCEKVFHPSCCRYWPQARITKSQNKIESFRCPSHVCHTCVSDDPKGNCQILSSAKLTKCVKCPASYHTNSSCIPAGSQVLTAAYIICSRHGTSDSHFNLAWCFICAKGGVVVCCETCPMSVHAKCINLPIDPNEGYICIGCESGQLPLYGEIVWAKYTSYRWWPAIILPPNMIPSNVLQMTHSPTDFVVRFFGSHNHGWLPRSRVYTYEEEDVSAKLYTKTFIDKLYIRGVEEAKQIYGLLKLKKQEQEQNLSNKTKIVFHPEPYVRIKANRGVHPVKLNINLKKVTKCACKPDDEDPCGPKAACLNRMTFHECNPKMCPADERCQNQMFDSRIYPSMDVVYIDNERGFGLVCREDISAGTFVIEYVGEIINDREFQERTHQKSLDRDKNLYFLSVEKDYIIDAGPKGNLARFMNHSCDPNCEAQKWVVNGLNRIGLFAIKDIPADTELTFNYHWNDLFGGKRRACLCGTAKCTGHIGGKAKR